MNDYFVYDNDSIAPSYIPGIVAYGQQGAPGNTGDSGASVFYSSYDLSYTNDKNEDVINLIRQGKALSNNSHYNEDVSYKENDIIIDAVCNFYRITNDLSYESLEGNNITLSDITSNITSFTISCVTSFFNNTKYPNNIDNDSYDSSVTSYKYIHNDTNTKQIYGNYVKFSLLFKEGFDTNRYTYRFVLVLPNGKLLELDSENNIDTIFVDNKLLFGNFDMLTWNDTANITLNNILNISNDNDSMSLDLDNDNDTTLYNLMKRINDSSLNENIDETNKKVSIITSYLIKNNCYGYAEMMNKSSGISYRINLSDVFLNNSNNSDSSLSEDNNHINHIVENTANVKWKAALNEYKQGKFLMNKNGKLFNPFISYAMFETSDKDNILSETSLSEQFYFVDVAGFSHYITSTVRSCNEKYYEDLILQPNENDIVHNYFMQYVYKRNEINKLDDNNFIYKLTDDYYIADRNRTYKILLKDTKKISINIIFTNYSTYGGLTYQDNENAGVSYTVNYPGSLVYVGVPDSSLIVFDSSINGGGYIKYTSKFVPPGYNVNDESATVAEAGMANVTLDLENYKLIDSSVHTIEIGVTLLDDISLNHTYVPNENNNNKNEYHHIIFNDKNINLINSKHRPTSSGSIFYRFENGYYTGLNIKEPFGPNNNYKTYEHSSGIPDIKVYVTSLEEGTPISNNDSSVLDTLVHIDKPY